MSSAIIFFKKKNIDKESYVEADDMLSDIAQFLRSGANDMLSDIIQFLATIVAANQGRSFFDPKTSFSTHFDPKHFRQLDKLIHGLKKPSQNPKST